jgi:POT family proton-dependent oligopeptide transporter
LYFIFWGEFAERACFYGMRAILMLYMTKHLVIDEADASTYYYWFKTACYLLPLLGGFIADRYLGKYWTIVGFAVPYVLGQVLLTFGDRDMLFLALGLLAFGSGTIKPNISALLGLTYDQQRPNNLNLRAQAFYWFYLSINIGALSSMLALPLIRDYILKEYNDSGLAYRVAFSIPAVLMAMALLLFALGKPFYAKETPGKAPEQSPEEHADMWQHLFPLLGVFLLYVLFWIPYEHNDTQWVLFADKNMDTSTPWLAKLGGPDKLSGDAYQWTNALGVIILIPFFAWFWPRVDPTGRRITPIQKMCAGFIFTASAPLVMAVCAFMAEKGIVVSALWLGLAYFLLTLGEVLLYGTGLDFSYGQAPSSMKSTITACFLLTNAIGNFFNSFWARNYNNPDGLFPLTPLQFFAFDVSLPLLGAVLILIIGRRFHLAHRAGNSGM